MEIDMQMDNSEEVKPFDWSIYEDSNEAGH